MRTAGYIHLDYERNFDKYTTSHGTADLMGETMLFECPIQKSFQILHYQPKG
jgi:hypothetical protein